MLKNFLSESERQQLRAQHKRERDRRVADRIKAVLLKDRGYSFEEISKVLLLDDETIRKHVEEYRKNNKLCPENGGHYQGKLNDEQTKELIAHLTDNTYTSTKHIIGYVKEKYGVTYTQQGMYDWLKNHKFSFKKPKMVPHKANPELQKEFVEFYNDLERNLPENEVILFGDGVHPTMETKVSYGWIPTGKDKIISSTSSRSRMNILGVLDLAQMSVLTKDYETINENKVVDFLDLVKKRYKDKEKIYLILDNGGYFKTEKVKQKAKELNIFIKHIPPYSPNLNPIERLWKVMNEHVRNNVFFENKKSFFLSVRNFFKKTFPQIAHTLVDRINNIFSIMQTNS